MSFAQITPQQTALYLRTLPAIRERCSRVHALAKEGKLQYFEYHPEKEDSVADFCIDIIKVRSHPSNIVIDLMMLSVSSEILARTLLRYALVHIRMINILLMCWHTDPTPWAMETSRRWTGSRRATH